MNKRQRASPQPAVARRGAFRLLDQLAMSVLLHAITFLDFSDTVCLLDTCHAFRRLEPAVHNGSWRPNAPKLSRMAQLASPDQRLLIVRNLAPDALFRLKVSDVWANAFASASVAELKCLEKQMSRRLATPTEGDEMLLLFHAIYNQMMQRVPVQMAAVEFVMKRFPGVVSAEGLLESLRRGHTVTVGLHIDAVAAVPSTQRLMFLCGAWGGMQERERSWPVLFKHYIKAHLRPSADEWSNICCEVASTSKPTFR
jgi:hypothetical protein